MKKQTHSLPARILSMLLALVCILGLLPGAALAASPDSIVMEDRLLRRPRGRHGLVAGGTRVE